MSIICRCNPTPSITYLGCCSVCEGRQSTPADGWHAAARYLDRLPDAPVEVAHAAKALALVTPQIMNPARLTVVKL